MFESFLNLFRREEWLDPNVPTMDGDQALVALAAGIHINSLNKGFYDDCKPANHQDMAVKATLIASEVFEMIEELRYPELRIDENTGDFCEEVEWADVFIRLLDYAAARGFSTHAMDIVRRKHAYNLTRPVKHGKLF